MTTMEFKHYKVLKDFFAAEAARNATMYCKAMNSAVALDFDYAFEMWEYVLLDRDEFISKDTDAAVVYVDKTEEILESKSPTKFSKALIDSAVARNAVFKYSPTCFEKTASINHLASLFLKNNLDGAEEVIKCAIKNTVSKGTFGSFLNAAVDKTILELTKKNPAKVVINKKLATYILGYAQKLKGAEKPLIIQKIKEIL